MYQNKNVLLATMHQKEKVVAPVFLDIVGCHIEVPEDFDTDVFGTFSGEIKRVKSAFETCRDKAMLSAKQLRYEYALASEGSFGPHPHVFFTPADTEIMVFVDLKNDIEVSEYVISTNTNFAQHELTETDYPKEFLTRIGFPEHAVVVKSASNNHFIAKGISSDETLLAAIEQGLEHSEKIVIETDMRAMFNPKRMQVIAEVAEKLARRLSALCQQCGSPGFGKKTLSGNLPCELCGMKTQLHQWIHHSCIKCEHQLKYPREDGKERAEARFCDFCNP